jgi:hypothetical protein
LECVETNLSCVFNYLSLFGLWYYTRGFWLDFAL